MSIVALSHDAASNVNFHTPCTANSINQCAHSSRTANPTSASIIRGEKIWQARILIVATFLIAIATTHFNSATRGPTRNCSTQSAMRQAAWGCRQHNSLALPMLARNRSVPFCRRNVTACDFERTVCTPRSSPLVHSALHRSRFDAYSLPHRRPMHFGYDTTPSGHFS